MLAAGSTAAADEVRVGKLPYADVTVTGFDAGRLSFRTPAREVAKPLKDVTRIRLDGRPDFNEGEELYTRGQYAKAAEAYRRAEQAAIGAPWLRRLIHYRMVEALDGAGRFDEAVEKWLLAVAESEVAGSALALRPDSIPEKGAQPNERAILLLKVKLRQVENEGFARSIRELLLKLYRREGRSEDAAELAAAMGRPPAAGEAPDSGAEPSGTVPAVPSARVADLQALLDQGRPRKALELVEMQLGRFGAEEVPAAMLLAGRARVALYASEGDRARLLSAGLDFMRVVTFYPGTPAAAEALYRAGEVNAELGNAAAARNAWQAVIRRYGDSEFAEPAAGAIQQLSESGSPGGGMLPPTRRPPAPDTDE